MPTYEMPLLLRVMNKSQTAATLKKAAETIFDKSGFIRKIENLGLKQTPYRMSAHDQIHKSAHYFIFHFDMPPLFIRDIIDMNNRDIDIIRTSIIKQNRPSDYQCKIHEEMLPSPYRPSVQKLLQIEKVQQKKNKKKFEYNNGLTYNPFQR